MKHLKRFDEGLFDLFKKKYSDDDKIALDFIKRLERVKDVSPYKIELDTEDTEQGECYYTTYKVVFDDVEVRVRKVEADRKYRYGWEKETQKNWIKNGAIRKNDHVFYGITIHMVGGKESITPSPKITEQFFELIEKVNKQSKYKSRINKIRGEMNPAADLLDPEIYPGQNIKEGIKTYEGFFEEELETQEIRDICLELTDIGFRVQVNEIPQIKREIKIRVTIDNFRNGHRTLFDIEDIKEYLERIKDFMTEKGYQVEIFVPQKHHSNRMDKIRFQEDSVVIDSFVRIYPIDYKISFCEMFITSSNWFKKTIKSN